LQYLPNRSCSDEQVGEFEDGTENGEAAKQRAGLSRYGFVQIDLNLSCSLVGRAESVMAGLAGRTVRRMLASATATSRALQPFCWSSYDAGELVRRGLALSLHALALLRYGFALP
jgi:hypothetical protein